MPPLTPRRNVPVFAKLTALAIDPEAAGNDKLNPCEPTDNVAVDNAPLNKIVPVVFVNDTWVPAVTAPLNVVPPELVMVRFRRGVTPPTIPETLIAPDVPAFKVKDWVLATEPSIVLVNEI